MRVPKEFQPNPEFARFGFVVGFGFGYVGRYEVGGRFIFKQRWQFNGGN